MGPPPLDGDGSHDVGGALRTGTPDSAARPPMRDAAASPSMSRALSRWVPLAVAAGAVVLALTFLPPYSDGDFGVFDGISYAVALQGVEHIDRETVWVLTHSNHMLSHALAYAFVVHLRGLGIPQPGFVAGRLLAGLGAAAIVLLLARLAGRGRGALGAAFALAPLAARGMLLDLGSGETVVPGAAAALGALVLACRRPVRLRELGVVLVLAVLVRQDNVLVVPAALWAAAQAFEPGQRVRRAAVLGGAVGLAVVTIYLLAYWAHPVEAGLFEYVLGIGRTGAWTYRDEVDVLPPLLHLGAFAWALVGRTGGIHDPQLLATLAYAGGLLLAGWLLGGGRVGRRVGPARGSGALAAPAAGGARPDPFLGAGLLVLAVRVPFFCWFEPENWEWQVLPLVLVAACGARLSAGRAAASAGEPLPASDARPDTDREPAGTARVRGDAARVGWRGALGLALVLAVPAGLLAAHGEDTWRLRRTTLRPAVEHALERAGPDAEVYIIGARVGLVLDILERPYGLLEFEHPAHPFPPDYDKAVRTFFERCLTNRAGPTLLVVDPFVRDTMPGTRPLARRYDALASRARRAGHEPLYWGGLTYAVLAPPAKGRWPLGPAPVITR